MNGDTFEPPTSLAFIGNFFDFFSQSTLVMFSDEDRQAQAQYIKELCGMISIISLTWIVWSFLLLSCHADCASGKGKDYFDDHSDTSNEEDNDDSSQFETDSINNETIATNAAVLTNSNSSTVDENFSYRCFSIFSCCCSNQLANRRRRRYIIRAFFALFGLLSAISGALILPKTYSPIINAAETTSHHLEDVQLILSKIQRLLKVVDQTADATLQINAELKDVLPGLCPGLPQSEFVWELGVDPVEIGLVLERGYQDFYTSAGDTIAQVHESTTDIDALIRNVEFGIQSVQDEMWILPLLTIGMTILTYVCLLAVFWAILQERFPSTCYHALSQDRFEQVLAYFILPLFAFLITVIWILLSALAIGAVVVSDICLPSPNSSIHSIISSRGMDMESFLGQSISSYVSGCNMEEDPIEMLHIIEEILHSNVNILGERLEGALIVGFGRLEYLCGPNNTIDVFFSAMGRLYYHLDNAYNVLVESRALLECQYVHELYIEFVDDSICSEFAGAISKGVILIFTLAISGMMLMTLRVAWRLIG